ncbi:methylated-DNA--[protein]-cysteine S-methyltransferase [bacterium]|nr:methylated-DNA--[protein]-cysteine S-methyltransferase [bacterium]
MERSRLQAGWLEDTPVGTVLVVLKNISLLEVRLNVEGDPVARAKEISEHVVFGHGTVNRVLEAFRRYFSGEDPLGMSTLCVSYPVGITDFRLRIYEALRTIPPGDTVSYGELAAMAGKPGAARAVGTAMAENPVPIVIPCHRVVATDGLGGFTGGLDLKKTLLRLERSQQNFALDG